MYADQPVTDASVANNAAAAKAQAEQAAWAELDKTSQVLIENYFAQVETATYAGVPSLRESDLS